MKSQLTSLDLHFIVNELSSEGPSSIIGSKVQKIYQISKKEFLFLLHNPKTKKQILRIRLPEFIFLSEFKEEMPQQPLNFAVFLRKRISNSVITSISQLGFERIAKIVLEKDKKYMLYIELFSKGNIILCDENNKILLPLEPQKWKSREIKKGLSYVWPAKEYDFTKMTLDELKTLLENTSKESVVKALALDLGLGGIYAEELCFLAKIDKSKKKLNGSEIKALFSAIEKLRKAKISPITVDNEIFPFPLLSLGHKPGDDISFNKALDSFVSSKIAEKQKQKMYNNAKLEQYKLILEKQLKSVKELEDKIAKNQEKAELIYQYYAEINGLLAALKNHLKKSSLQDLRQLLKEKKLNPMVKDINPKDKTITIELK